MWKYAFIKGRILLWRTLLSRSWYFVAKFPLKWFQPALRSSREDAARCLCSSRPGCPVLGLPAWFRGLRSQRAFLSHTFCFCIFRDYMSPYFSVSHTFLSVTLTAEVSWLCQKYLPPPLNKCHLIFHRWLKLAWFSRMAFVMCSFSCILQDLTKQTVLAAASTGGGFAFAANPRSLFRIWVLRVSSDTGQCLVSAGSVRIYLTDTFFSFIYDSTATFNRKWAAFRVGVAVAGKFLGAVWSLLTKRSLPAWGRCHLLPHCCCSFSSSVRCCLWRGGIFLGKGVARGSGLGESWVKCAGDLRHLLLWGEILQLHVFFCLSSLKLSPKCVSCRSKRLLSTAAFGRYQAFTQGACWVLGDHGQPAMVSCCYVSCEPCEIQSHTPASFLLPSLWMLVLGNGKHLGWEWKGLNWPA